MTFGRGWLARIPLDVGLVVLSFVLWLSSLVRADYGAMGDLGLLSILPIEWYLALGAVCAALVVASSSTDRTIAGLASIVMLVLLLHATGPLLSDIVRFEWAWKHIGVTEFIGRTGSVDRGVDHLEVYHHWPGFFAGAASWVGLAGYENAQPLALWGSVFFSLAAIGPLWMILSSFTADPRIRLLALGIYYPINWVGQDYFSPQATGYLLHITTIGLLLNSPAALPTDRLIRPSLRNLVAMPSGPGAGRLVTLTTLLAIAIIPTHQLTPVALASACAFLAIAGVRSGWLSVVVMSSMAAWAVTFAWPAVSRSLADIVGTAGRAGTNVQLVSLGSMVSEQQLVVHGARVLVAGCVLLALIGMVTRFRTRTWGDRTAFALVCSSVMLLAANEYGGEIMFRVVLFGSPYLAYFAARGAVAFAQLPGRVADRHVSWPSSSGPLVSGLSRSLEVGLLTVLATLFVVANNGKDRYYSFSRDEVAANEWIYTQPYNDESSVLLVAVTTLGPHKAVNYERFVHVPIELEPAHIRDRFLDDGAGMLFEWMINPDYDDALFIIGRTDRVQASALGVFPTDSLVELEDELRASDRFEVVFDTPDAAVFRALRRAGGPRSR